MAYESAKGLVSIAVSHFNNEFQYQKIDFCYIQPNGYTATPDQMQDKDSYVNAKGFLRRTVLPHSRTKIEWNTPYLTLKQKCKLVSLIKKGFSAGGECNQSQRNEFDFIMIGRMIMIICMRIFRILNLSREVYTRV